MTQRHETQADKAKTTSKAALLPDLHEPPVETQTLFDLLFDALLNGRQAFRRVFLTGRD